MEVEIVTPLFALEPIYPHTLGSFKNMIFHGIRRKDL